jgi:hypothetical protein
MRSQVMSGKNRDMYYQHLAESYDFLREIISTVMTATENGQPRPYRGERRATFCPSVRLLGIRDRAPFLTIPVPARAGFLTITAHLCE